MAKAANLELSSGAAFLVPRERVQDDPSNLLHQPSQSLFSSVTDAKILTLCRRVSKIHFEMILVPTVLVGTRMRPDLGAFYSKHRRSWGTRLALVVLGACVVGLPWVYAHTVMAYPCESKDIKLGPPEGDMKTMEIKPQGCEVEQTLLRYPFRLGEVLMATSLALTILLDLMTRVMYCLYYSCGRPACILNLKRLMWRPLLLFWHSWINKKIPHLRFSNDFHVFPPLYSPPSVVICWVYLVLIVEMFLISAQERNFSLGIVVAYAMGELLLKIGNVLMEPATELELVTTGEVRQWLPEGWTNGSMTVFDRLHELIQDGKRHVHISTAELFSLEQLDTKVALERPSDRREGDDSMDGVGVITKVYVVDAGLAVDLVQGTVTSVAAGLKLDDNP